ERLGARQHAHSQRNAEEDEQALEEAVTELLVGEARHPAHHGGAAAAGRIGHPDVGQVKLSHRAFPIRLAPSVSLSLCGLMDEAAGCRAPDFAACHRWLPVTASVLASRFSAMAQ